MATETAAQKKAREEQEAEARKAQAVSAVQRPDENSHNVLTEGMPTPPGLRERRSRRIRRTRRQGPFVKYVGAASHRVIRPADWKTIPGCEPVKAGKEDGVFQTNTWSPKNDFLVESSSFSDSQLDYLLIDDVHQTTGAHNFLEVDYDDNGQLVQVLEDDEADSDV